ncbi:hypothetical protein GpartN1_g356.t1 [Galdieria partita]|uniref:Uncharacterized protein n=1 Tax=Galdieria partita TaxID=83374 RepID=A0A9C7PQG6_9RHOD|nr:hypothetical protein GpartN1_g356.t1 [Galdieria partita]
MFVSFVELHLFTKSTHTLPFTPQGKSELRERGHCYISCRYKLRRCCARRWSVAGPGLVSRLEGKNDLLERFDASSKHFNKKRNDRNPEFYANLGTVIETLRSDYSHILEKEIDYSIYDEDLILRDRVHGQYLQGKEAYKTILWLLRVHTHIAFRQAFMDVKSMYYDDDSAIIYLRWGVRAVPRLLPWDVHRQRYIDGLSIYRLNGDGWVQEHIVDNVLQTPIRLPSLVENLLSLGTIRLRSPAGVGVQGGSSQCGSQYDNFLASVLKMLLQDVDSKGDCSQSSKSSRATVESQNETNGEVEDG